MGLFDIWKPKPEDEKGKPKAPPSNAPPHALPHKSEQVHALPGPAPVQAPKKADPFAMYAPKEPKNVEAPKVIERPKSLMDAMVPQEERGAMYHRRPEPEIYRRSPEPEIMERPAPPQRPPPARRRIREWTPPSPEEFASRLDQMFNLRQVFEEARRQSSGLSSVTDSRDAVVIPLVPIAPSGDVDILGYFFGVPRETIDSYLEGVGPDQEVAAMNDLWDEIFWPLFDMTTAAFEIVKPEDLQGWFRLNTGVVDSRVIELQYLSFARP